MTVGMRPAVSPTVRHTRGRFLDAHEAGWDAQSPPIAPDVQPRVLADGSTESSYRIHEHGDAFLTAWPATSHAAEVFGEVRVYHLYTFAHCSR